MYGNRMIEVWVAWTIGDMIAQARWEQLQVQIAWESTLISVTMCSFDIEDQDIVLGKSTLWYHCYCWTRVHDSVVIIAATTTMTSTCTLSLSSQLLKSEAVSIGFTIDQNWHPAHCRYKAKYLSIHSVCISCCNKSVHYKFIYFFERSFWVF